MDRELIELLNPEFPFKLGEKTYQIKKPSITLMTKFYSEMQRLMDSQDISNATKDMKVLAYCIYLLVSPQDTELTVEKVEDMIPGDVDTFDLLGKLGFMNPLMKEAIQKAKQSLTENSLHPFQNAQDGLQPKSEISPENS